MNTFEERRNARVDRLLAAAERREKEAAALHGQAHQMGDAIPFGQPILVGHHSEGRDRRYRERIENKYRKSFALSDEAVALRARAEAAAKNTAIFSDDPNAVEKLEDKIARLEARQERMKAANKLVRKKDRAGLAEMGFSEDAINALFTPDFAGRLGFPDYRITNNGANIRRLKERVKTVTAHRADETTEQTLENGVRLVDSVEDNRYQVFFPTRVSAELYAKLKSHGFRWTPSQDCFQAYRGNGSKYYGELLAKEYVRPQ